MEWREETSSTNDDVRSLALKGAPEGTAVAARRQHAGRGRQGRTFVSPEGGLYLSVLLRPKAPPSAWSVLPLAAGLAVAEALDAAGVACALKWPNDVLVDDQKLGGILVESTWGRPPFAVVGIGLNVGMAPIEGAAALPASVELPQLAEAIQDGIVALARRADDGGPPAVKDILTSYRERCVTLGRTVTWEGSTGRAVDIAEDGALIVEANGRRLRLIAGDVHLEKR